MAQTQCMGADVHTPDKLGGWSSPRTLQTLAARLDVVGIVALVLSQVVRLGVGEGDGLWGKVALVVCSVAFLLCICAAGVMAAVSLWKEPLESRSGRWASALAAFNALFLPLVWVVSWLGAAVGLHFSVSWGMPYFPVWAAAALGALILSFVDRGERSRWTLIGSTIAGAAVLTFFLGDMVAMP